MRNYLEIQFWKIAKRIIVAGYGCSCETSDLDDFPKIYKKPKDVFNPARCASCRAKEVCDWIDSHIELIRD